MVFFVAADVTFMLTVFVRSHLIIMSPYLQEQARKALDSALGEKKTEFEKWNKEIQKREERGGGGASGRGGWFGGGGWFGWFSGDHFWEEAQQAIIAIVGIISLVRIHFIF